MKRLLIATGNPGKAAELRGLLGPSVQVETLADHPELVLPEENGETFAENARLKAEHASQALGVAALADDSGLEVDALGGAPGVRSARYAPGSDADRVTKLLGALADVPDDRRTARFVCALAFVIPGAEPRLTEGRVEGRIGRERRGAHGFGYDPVFEVGAEDLRTIGVESPKTMAELTRDEKSTISHRGRAVAAMLPELERHFSLVLSATIP